MTRAARRLKQPAKIIAWIIFTSACAPHVPVTNAAIAISIGSKICDRQWGKDFGYDLKARDWRATRFGDKGWVVSLDGERGARMEVNIPMSGADPSQCGIYGPRPPSQP